MLWIVVGVMIFSVVGAIALAGLAVVLLRDSVPIPARVPEVAGRPGDEAGRILRSEGFRVEREPARGSRTETGMVVRQDPAAGSFEGEGTTVTIAVATLAEVPDLTSTDRGDAEDRLPEGLRVETGGVEADDVPAGTVLTQDPAPGEKVPWDTAVSVVVSAGAPGNPGDIFEEDFSEDRASGNPGGWTLGEDDFGNTIEYADGGLRLYNNPESDYVIESITRSAGSVEDSVVEVDAASVGGAPGESGVSVWGVACRAETDTAGGYRMLISDSGYAQIIKYPENGPASVLAEGFRGGAIREATGINDIRADCVGDELSLYANSRRILRTTDAEFTEGSTGLFVSYTSDQPPGISVLFDNFRVSTPE